jgi:hypothetical protein
MDNKFKVQAVPAAKIAGSASAQLAGPNGHFTGVIGVAQAGDKIRAFLDAL